MWMERVNAYVFVNQRVLRNLALLYSRCLQLEIRTLFVLFMAPLKACVTCFKSTYMLNFCTALFFLSSYILFNSQFLGWHTGALPPHSLPAFSASLVHTYISMGAAWHPPPFSSFIFLFLFWVCVNVKDRSAFVLSSFCKNITCLFD